MTSPTPGAPEPEDRSKDGRPATEPDAVSRPYGEGAGGSGTSAPDPAQGSPREPGSAPGYGQPADAGYGQSAPGYDQPADAGYGQPAPGYSGQPSGPGPEPGYGAPQQPTPAYAPGAGYGQQPPQGPGPFAQPYGMPDASAQAFSNLTINYWLSVFFGWIPALIFFLIDRNKAPLVDRHNADLLNFTLLELIVNVVLGFIGGIGALLIVPLFLPAIAWIAFLVLKIIAAINGPTAAREGRPYKWPFNIPLVKP